MAFKCACCGGGDSLWQFVAGTLEPITAPDTFQVSANDLINLFSGGDVSISNGAPGTGDIDIDSVHDTTISSNHITIIDGDYEVDLTANGVVGPGDIFLTSKRNITLDNSNTGTGSIFLNGHFGMEVNSDVDVNLNAAQHIIGSAGGQFLISAVGLANITSDAFESFAASYITLQSNSGSGKITFDGKIVPPTAAATTLGSVVARMPVYDSSGSLVGYAPLYDSIT